MRESEHIPLRDAEVIVDALNDAATISSVGERLHSFVLRCLQELLGRTTSCSIVVLTDLRRHPAPRVVQRMRLSPDQKPIVAEEDLQATVDVLQPLIRLQIPAMLRRRRTPITSICSEDIEDRHWFEEQYVAEVIGPAGYVDSLISCWAAADDRAVAVSIHRRADDPPFSEDDRQRMSLIVRAMAPLIDRECFSEGLLQRCNLTQRQTEVLRHLLTGASEKEIGRRLNRSPHTVHTFVRQIYDRFGVSSRGQLMALFVDESLVRSASE